MSMWLSLAKVSPELLVEIRNNPDLLDAIFFDDDFTPAGLDERSDVFGCDYLTLSAVATACSEVERPGVDWREHFAWLGRATGENTGDQLPGYEFTYGPAFAFEPSEVQLVADGMAAETWSLDEDDRRELGLDDDDDDDEDEPEFDDFVDLVPFFGRAAREGKAVVGGIS